MPFGINSENTISATKGFHVTQEIFPVKKLDTVSFSHFCGSFPSIVDHLRIIIVFNFAIMFPSPGTSPSWNILSGTADWFHGGGLCTNGFQFSNVCYSSLMLNMSFWSQGSSWTGIDLSTFCRTFIVTLAAQAFEVIRDFHFAGIIVY